MRKDKSALFVNGRWSEGVCLFEKASGGKGSRTPKVGAYVCARNETGGKLRGHVCAEHLAEIGASAREIRVF